MSYKVYLVEYHGMPYNYQAIFVESHENGPQTGRIIQVKGNIQEGMTFEEKPAKSPESPNTYVLGKKDLIGTVAVDDLARFAAKCRENPPPAKQFDGPKLINPGVPLRRCQEWTAETIQSLKDAGILQG